MEGRKSPRCVNSKVAHIHVRLSPPKLLKQGSSQATSSTKLNALKLKIYYKQMQKLRASPEINAVSRALIQSSRNSSPPNSPYIKRILSNNKYIKSISSRSTTSYATTFDSPKYSALLNKVDIKLESNEKAANQNKCDIFQRNIEKLKRREEVLSQSRKFNQEKALSECTFRPIINRPKSALCRVNKDLSVIEKMPRTFYKSLSPSARNYRFDSGCNLNPILEKATPMFKYLSVKLPYI